jgi:hypothetical protein
MTDVLALQNIVDPETEVTDDLPWASLLSIICAGEEN